MLWFLAGLMLPALAAYPWVAYCDRDARHDAAACILRISLAFGAGVGISSCTCFLWLFAGGTLGTTYHVCELAGFAIAGCLGLLAARASATPAGERCLSAPMSIGRWQPWLLIAFCAALVMAGVGAVGNYWDSPLGGWDAWAIWNQRARFIFRAGDQWRQAFLPESFHTDYPLLLPNSVARLWSYLGAEETWAPWLLGSLFTLAVVGVLAAGVCRLRSRSQGLLAGLVLLGMVSFLYHGTLQQADIPLAFFMLSAVLLLTLYDASQRPHRRMLMLSGLMAGLAAWTKNEGLLFLAVLPVTWCALAWRRDGAKRACRGLLCWGAGAMPALVAIVIQKACLAGGNDLVDGQSWHASLARLCDPLRYWYVSQAFALYVLRTTRPFAVVLPLTLLLLGIAPKRSRGGLGLPTAVLLLMLAGYFLVYLTTPHDLTWHLKTSMERLLLHLWPLCLLILFLGVATPEELWADESHADVLLQAAERRGESE